MRHSITFESDDTPAIYTDQLIVALVRHGHEVHMDYDLKNVVTYVDPENIQEIK